MFSLRIVTKQFTTGASAPKRGVILPRQKRISHPSTAETHEKCPCNAAISPLGTLVFYVSLSCLRKYNYETQQHKNSATVQTILCIKFTRKFWHNGQTRVFFCFCCSHTVTRRMILTRALVTKARCTTTTNMETKVTRSCVGMSGTQAFALTCR